MVLHPSPDLVFVQTEGRIHPVLVGHFVHLALMPGRVLSFGIHGLCNAGPLLDRRPPCPS